MEKVELVSAIRTATNSSSSSRRRRGRREAAAVRQLTWCSSSAQFSPAVVSSGQFSPAQVGPGQFGSAQVVLAARVTARERRAGRKSPPTTIISYWLLIRTVFPTIKSLVPRPAD